MSRWGWDRDDVMRMSVGMQQNFTNHGLPYSFTERGMVANTRDAHRVLAWCAAVSPAAQDKAVEVLFKGYFGDERAPNDPSLLVDACVAAGKPYAEAAAFVDDKTAMAAEVDAELAAAKKMRIDGVPHFIFKKPGKAPVEVTGAMPAPVLAQALA
mmetsp:Transcript_25258/g.77887  ORF Transcript_25258/g.77887 Transcript_25258/m.77887 type:complete len:155 (+) Transcript_25258:1714-2178(+)